MEIVPVKKSAANLQSMANLAQKPVSLEFFPMTGSPEVDPHQAN